MVVGHQIQGVLEEGDSLKKAGLSSCLSKRKMNEEISRGKMERKEGKN